MHVKTVSCWVVPSLGATHYTVSTHSSVIILVKYGPACVQLILLREREREKIRIRV